MVTDSEVVDPLMMGYFLPRDFPFSILTAPTLHFFSLQIPSRQLLILAIDLTSHHLKYSIAHYHDRQSHEVACLFA